MASLVNSNPCEGTVKNEDQHSTVTNNAASIVRLFKYHRDPEPPILPKGYDWKIQKKMYCPRKLPTNAIPPPKFGYVFCHRGFYERAKRILDNSVAAIANGTQNDFFLHEVDAFVLERLDKAFIAHDMNLGRVTPRRTPLDLYPFNEVLKTPLVTRRVNEEEEADFVSSFIETDGKVPGVFDVFMKESTERVGHTLQIDLRAEDLARTIPYYSHHLWKFRNVKFWRQRRNSKNYHKGKEFWALFESTMIKSTILKGYADHYPSFGHLHHAISENSRDMYGDDYFRLSQLPSLPPIILVFYAKPLIALARQTSDSKLRADWRTYQHIHKIFRDQVLSFVDLDVKGQSYSFIPEIVHSGLGLGYDKQTGEARNPLDGQVLQDRQVIFHSLVDRVMIDVSLELREKYPQLLFSSCTRLPDVIRPDGSFMASYKTSHLMPWLIGEKGLASKLRAIHGGLFPQSHLVVADDPCAEISARTWIDQESDLDRSQLLRVPGRSWRPYKDWLAQATEEVVTAITKLNDQEFLPNKFGEPVPADNAWDSANTRHETSEPPEPRPSLNVQVKRWMEDFPPPDHTSDLSVFRHENTAPRYDLTLAGDGSAWEDDLSRESASEAWEYNQRRQSADEAREKSLLIKVSGYTFIYQGGGEEPSMFHKTAALHTAAARGDENMLREAMSIPNIKLDAPGGTFGTALATASAKGHKSIVSLLLERGAWVWNGGPYGSPLELAARFGHIDIVEMLFEALEKKNMRRGIATTPHPGYALFHAARHGQEAVVRLLLDKGVDVDSLGWLRGARKGHTALEAACSIGHRKIFDMLLDKGAKVNAGQGALKQACLHGRLDMIMVLIKREPVVDFSLKSIKPDIVSLLQDAKVCSPNKDEHHDSRDKTLDRKVWTMTRKNMTGRRRDKYWHECDCPFCVVNQTVRPRLRLATGRQTFRIAQRAGLWDF